MSDLMYLGLTILFFAANFGLLTGCERLRRSERLMLYVVAGTLCGLLLAYLFVALLKPEWFG